MKTAAGRRVSGGAAAAAPAFSVGPDRPLSEHFPLQPDQRIVVSIHHPFVQRDDAVVGDVDVLGAVCRPRRRGGRLSSARPNRLSEAALLASEVASTALRLRRTRVSTVTATLRIGGSRGPGRTPPLLGLVNLQRPSVELLTVEGFDGLGGFLGARVLDEGEAAGSAGRSVAGHVYVHDLSGFGEQARQVGLGGLVVQVANENLCWNLVFLRAVAPVSA